MLLLLTFEFLPCVGSGNNAKIYKKMFSPSTLGLTLFNADKQWVKILLFTLHRRARAGSTASVKWTSVAVSSTRWAKEPADALLANNSCCAWWTLCSGMQKLNSIQLPAEFHLLAAFSGTNNSYDRDIQGTWQEHAILSQKRYTRYKTSKSFWGLSYLFEVCHIFLRFGTDWYIPDISF